MHTLDRFWANFEATTDGRKYLYERLSELSSDYPLPPYEPTLTTLPALAQEVLTAFELLATKHLSRASILPLYKEFVDAWDRDPIMHSLAQHQQQFRPALTRTMQQLGGRGGEDESPFAHEQVVLARTVQRTLGEYASILRDNLIDTASSADFSKHENVAIRFLNYAYVSLGWSSRGIADRLRWRFAGTKVEFDTALQRVATEVSAPTLSDYDVYVDVTHQSNLPQMLTDRVDVKTDVRPETRAFAGATCLHTAVQASDAWSAATKAGWLFDEAVTAGALLEKQEVPFLGTTMLVVGSQRQFVRREPVYETAVRLPSEDLAMLTSDPALRDVLYWVRVGNTSVGEERILAYWIALEFLSWRATRSDILQRVTMLSEAVWSTYYFGRVARTLFRQGKSQGFDFSDARELLSRISAPDGQSTIDGMRSILLRHRLTCWREGTHEYQQSVASIGQLVARIYRIRNMVAHGAARNYNLRMDWLSVKTARLLRAYLRQYAALRREIPDISPREFFYRAEAEKERIDGHLRDGKDLLGLI